MKAKIKRAGIVLLIFLLIVLSSCGQGEQGEAGPEGKIGPRGENGAQGERGPAGEDGAVVDNMTYINVKNFGAVGDGKTDDKAALLSAFEYALQNLPATVYFPEGEYGLSEGGLYISLPLGVGGLTVCGDGGELSVLKYLPEWEPAHSWVALRLQPETTPSESSEYLHDITIRDLGVYDTDPLGHAWTEEENGSKEETHGFDIQYCRRATVQNCNIINVGDEAIDMVYCVDSMIVGNYVSGSPGAGSGGGAISVGDGCRGVLVSQNIVNGSVLDDEKGNFGIAIESLTDPVVDVTLTSNMISNVNGWGINVGTGRGSIEDIVISGNHISSCRDGGIRLRGSYPKTNILISDVLIEHVDTAILMEGSQTTFVSIRDFTIDDALKGIYVGGSQNVSISDGVMTKVAQQAYWGSGNYAKLDNLLIDSVGFEENVTSGAIQQYPDSGRCDATNVTVLNCQNPKAFQNIYSVINCTVEQKEASGIYAISKATVIRGGQVNGIVSVNSGGLIDGLTVRAESDLGLNPIYLYNVQNVIVTNCTVSDGSSRAGIRENGTADHNMILNNFTKNGVQVVGEHTVVQNNIVPQ
ncbi:MAG: right-handed parallel beta-helix repeat-containing protein [Clostridia bacterium]|nr:right-handed parallel beta-helix repeat-containing protein [Clostridia bacterium]